MWSRNKANLYIHDALADFHYDPKALLSPPKQYKMYKQKLIATHLTGFGGGGSVPPVTTLSYSFDGTGDSLTSPDHADWTLGGGGGNFNVEFWVKFNDLTRHGWIEQNQGGTAAWSFWYHNSQGANFQVKAASAEVVAVTQAGVAGWSADTWYHVALIRGWSGNADDYAITRGGVPIATATDNTAITANTGSLEIGTDFNGPSVLNGFMDEIRISNVARKTADFSGDLPSAEYTSDANTHLLIHCNETIVSGSTGSGATFVDSGNTGHTVTEVGNAQRDTTTYKF